MKISETIAASLLASALMFTLAGCEQQGPLEEAGEAVDDKVEDAGDAIEDTTDGN
ncbi:lipoprotein [Thiohalobacter thiocyanaticus]|nr:hypothetical protein [Thiohalobacter thiocyanaticus]